MMLATPCQICDHDGALTPVSTHTQVHARVWLDPEGCACSVSRSTPSLIRRATHSELLTFYITVPRSLLVKELAATPKTQAAEAPRRLVALRLALYCCLLCAAFVFFSLELEGYTWGYATYTQAGQEGASYGKYITVWQRQDDGSWKWIADMGSGAPAPEDR